jgi:hypothetical protein
VLNRVRLASNSGASTGFACRGANNEIAAALAEPVQDSGWMDDEEWLCAIGLMRNEVLFRTCLQLGEPEEDAELWQLRIMLQDL